MREIGGEFWNVPQVEKDNRIFPESTQWFLSGRSALQAIVRKLKGCHTVAMPSWCCDSMIRPFINAGLEVNFYPVYWKNGLVQEIQDNCDVLFLMDYFGYTGAQLDLSNYEGVVIRDITHSIFSTSYSDADYYFGSLRKWCGVWTGGYAWTRDGREISVESRTDDLGYTVLREKAMQLKSDYIHGTADEYAHRTADKSYLGIFNEAEDVLETVDVVHASNRDVQAAFKLDVEFIRTQRRKNAEILRNAFPEWLIFREMRDTDCPMFVPILVPDGKRNELRRYLINNEIYCPVHWPVSEYHKLNERAKTIYANEISLVCDQRYTEEDMKRMVDTIKAFWLLNEDHIQVNKIEQGQNSCGKEA